MFFDKRKSFISFHKYDDLIHALISSLYVPLGITGKVYLKSPESSTVTPPIILVLLRISFNVLSTASTHFL